MDSCVLLAARQTLAAAQQSAICARISRPGQMPLPADRRRFERIHRIILNGTASKSSANDPESARRTSQGPSAFPGGGLGVFSTGFPWAARKRPMRPSSESSRTGSLLHRSTQNAPSSAQAATRRLANERRGSEFRAPSSEATSRLVVFLVQLLLVRTVRLAVLRPVVMPEVVAPDKRPEDRSAHVKRDALRYADKDAVWPVAPDED